VVAESGSTAISRGLFNCPGEASTARRQAPLRFGRYRHIAFGQLDRAKIRAVDAALVAESLLT
jgi:hypothetical protein